MKETKLFRDLRARHVVVAAATYLCGFTLAGLSEHGPDWLRYPAYVLVLPAVIVNALGGGSIYPLSFLIVLPLQLMYVYFVDLAARWCLTRLRQPHAKPNAK